MNIIVINWNERLQRSIFYKQQNKNLWDYLLYYIYFFLWIGILIKMRRLTKGICRKLSFHTWNVIHKSFLIFLVDLQQQLYTCPGKVFIYKLFQKHLFFAFFALFMRKMNQSTGICIWHVILCKMTNKIQSFIAIK